METILAYIPSLAKKVMIHYKRDNDVSPLRLNKYNNWRIS